MVSEFMLQQTQVTTVIPYFERWLERFPSFAALANASEAEVLGLWQGLGYYSRARNLHRAAQQVAEGHGGELPDDLGTISSLPGIGRYTAAAIAAFAFDRAVATVDGNIARVLARLFSIQDPIDGASGHDAVWNAAGALLPENGGRLYTSALMELGALLCTPRNPQCLICPVKNFCAADDPASLPRKKPRARTIALEEPCGWLIRKDKVFLEQQTGSRWRGMWKLPLLATSPDSDVIHESTYPFTNHRVTLRVFPVKARDLTQSPGQWIGLGDIDELPVTAPHRRAIRALLSQQKSRTTARVDA
jgi:A/G-specific adenine glycosylase